MFIYQQFIFAHWRVRYLSISISIFCSQDLKTTVNLSDEMRQVTQQNAKQVCMCNAVSCVAHIHNIYNNIYNTTIFTTQQYLLNNLCTCKVHTRSVPYSGMLTSCVPYGEFWPVVCTVWWMLTSGSSWPGVFTGSLEWGRQHRCTAMH